MARNIIAAIVGILVAGGIIIVIEMLGHTVYPPPADLDFADMEAMSTYVKTLPAGALLFVIAAWSLGAFGGTLAACKIGNVRSVIYAAIVGGLILAGTAYNLSVIPHPLWVAVLGVLGIIAGAWLGSRMGSNETAQ